jgi:hypothetical protein
MNFIEAAKKAKEENRGFYHSARRNYEPMPKEGTYDEDVAQRGI